MITLTAKLAPVPEGGRLQPLREIGTMEKTQFWEIEEIMEALRTANRHGIPLDDLRRRPDPTRIVLKAAG